MIYYVRVSISGHKLEGVKSIEKRTFRDFYITKNHKKAKEWAKKWAINTYLTNKNEYPTLWADECAISITHFANEENMSLAFMNLMSKDNNKFDNFVELIEYYEIKNNDRIYFDWRYKK